MLAESKYGRRLDIVDLYYYKTFTAGSELDGLQTQ